MRNEEDEDGEEIKEMEGELEGGLSIKRELSGKPEPKENHS